MKTKLYALHDADMGYANVFEAPNNMMAIRMFAEECQKPDSMVAKYANKFELHELGTIDKETGIITPEVKILEKATTYTKQN